MRKSCTRFILRNGQGRKASEQLHQVVSLIGRGRDRRDGTGDAGPRNGIGSPSRKLTGLVQRGEDRVQPAVERPAQLQHRDVSPGVQRVVVNQV
jgi:hypothetical protein